MNRLFGAKSKAPQETISSAISGIETSIEKYDVKIAGLNAELATYQQRLAKMPEGMAKTKVKQKARGVLQQRNQYEEARKRLQGSSMQLEQADMMKDNIKNAMVTFDAMKTASKELRKAQGKFDFDKADKIRDELEEARYVSEEIMNAFYDVPEDVDEDELDAELEALADQGEFEGIGESSAVPDFLVDEAPPQFIDEAPQVNKVKEAAG